MSAVIKSKSAEAVVIEITIPLKGSMLSNEESIVASLNEAGCLAAGAALERFDTDGSPLMIGDMKWTSKGQYPKTYQTLWGETTVERHVYQNSQGGRQFCPLENDARILLTATPGFARLVSLKYAEMGSSRVLFDLEQSHQRVIARSYLKLVSAGIYSACQRKDTASYRVLSFANEFRKNLSSR